MTTVRSRYDLSRAALGDLLSDEPAYRVDQVWSGLWKGADIGEITTLPKALREKLRAELPPLAVIAAEQAADHGKTVKWLWELGDGQRIETVLMHYPGRTTVCVSSQAGCAMGCGFCATGQAGFDRHLSAGEIVEQVVRAARRARENERRLSNVVFMGMGEPLANYEATVDALRAIRDEVGIGVRHLTVSTVGVVPGINRLAEEGMAVSLAISLHAANDTLRNELVPLGKRYPLAELVAAANNFRSVTGRRVSFEWALIANVNDRDTDADELAALAAGTRAHVNLIPLNPTPGYPAIGSSRARVAEFRDRLEHAGVNATIRSTRGVDIDAACGQLRANASAQG